MEKRNIVVGLFVVAGLVLFAVGLFLIGSRHSAFDHHMEYYAEFSNLGGLAKGAKVRVSGMEAGQVTEIKVPDSPSSRFRVKMQVDAKLHGLIRTDSLTTIGTEGVVGDTYLLIHTGSARAPAAGDHSTIPSKEPFDMAALLDKGDGLLNQAGKTIKDADTTIQQVGSGLTTTLHTVNTTVTNVDDVVAGIKQGRGAVGLLLQNQQFADQVRQTLNGATQATGSLAHASSQADQMISELQSRKLPQKVDDTLNSARSAAAQLDATSKQLNQTIAEATGPDSQGMTAGSNLRQTLSNTNAATANLADDTESLKHEFFFKGFFSKRGYYQLSNLSPETYRQNKAFTNQENRRAWLSASDLFELRPDGTEDLSFRGRQMLDDAVTQGGGSAMNQPIVVEGYSNSPDTSAQVALSRKRSILVSQYLQNHFQLDSRNVGFIGLSGSAPAGTGHAGWDGVCVVILRSKH